MTEAALFRWPQSAKFQRRMPKAQLERLADLQPRVRRSLTDDVREASWAYKLSPTTTGVPAGARIAEIQVIELGLKGRFVPEALIDALDSAIAHPVIFELRAGDSAMGEVLVLGATKTVSEKGALAHGPYHRSGWIDGTRDRRPLPVAPTLDALHDLLLAPLLGTERRASESVEAAERRLRAAAALDRVIAALERKMRSEPQLNRKLELRRELRSKQEERELLR
ncbi:DUF4391 family protein [Agrococcus sediminis]|uniref:DUF4391 family protein n=1 Tax=Agrococcus sediminis TaxID=2599924 RepID=A0A5M8QP71_9MICO|nr:DUF4391 domain-containing protein [Agrococcus sediminis]KAA6435962.1 DUF4391 family protein [Agrococcus sediminis]